MANGAATSQLEPDVAARQALCVTHQRVLARIEAACARAGRDPASVQLLAVSKTVPPGRIAALAACGQRAFGENYVQEACTKMDALTDGPGALLEWHCIGALQANKTRAVAARFDWVHSIDRLKIAQRLSAQRPEGMPPLSVCIELDVSGEAGKGGVRAAELPALAEAVVSLPGLALRGLMAIPAPSADPERQRAAFRQVREVFEALKARGFELDTLSMGMSADLESAILEGATIVRVGTALFGQRG